MFGLYACGCEGYCVWDSFSFDYVVACGLVCVALFCSDDFDCGCLVIFCICYSWFVSMWFWFVTCTMNCNNIEISVC